MSRVAEFRNNRTLPPKTPLPQPSPCTPVPMALLSRVAIQLVCSSFICSANIASDTHYLGFSQLQFSHAYIQNSIRSHRGTALPHYYCCVHCPDSHSTFRQPSWLSLLQQVLPRTPKWVPLQAIIALAHSMPFGPIEKPPSPYLHPLFPAPISRSLPGPPSFCMNSVLIL